MNPANLRQPKFRPGARARLAAFHLALLAAGSSPLGAQDAGPVLVTAPLLEDTTVVPANKPVPAILGLDGSVLDTPRGVTVLTRGQLEDAGIQGSEDLVRLVPGAYTYHVNGSPGAPLVRGQYADLLVNGIRLSLSSNGVGNFLDYHSAESVDVFRGPASALYGSSIYVGGFVNLNTKRPFFEDYHGSASATNGMYDQHRWEVDAGGPIIRDKLAWRVSYDGEESGSYYDNVHTQTQAVYGILSFTPNTCYQADLLDQFYVTDYSFNNGINRPTQRLIDDGLYVTGGQQFQNNTGLPVGAANPVANLTPSTTPGAFGVVAPTGLVHLDRGRDLVNPGDSSYAKTNFLELAQRYSAGPGLDILNTTANYYLDRRQFAALRYSAVVRGSYFVENRTEFKLNTDQPVPFAPAKPVAIQDKTGKEVKDAKASAEDGDGWVFHHQIDAGFDFRYTHVYAATDFNHELGNNYDLTANPKTIAYPFPDVVTGFNPSQRVPGTKFYATPGGTYTDAAGNPVDGGNGETNDSSLYDYALFFEDRIQFDRHWSAFVGGRGDLLQAYYLDPVPPPGFAAVDTSTIVGNYNVNASLTYKPVPHVTAYVTYDLTESLNSAQGGGILVGASNRISALDFHRKSRLLEGGVKASLFNDTLYLAADGYAQSRNEPQQGGTVFLAHLLGAEFDAAYQPNKNFSATLSYSYIDSKLVDQNVFQQTGNALDTFLPPVGTGVGSPNFTGPPKGTYRQPDIPHHAAGARFNYKLDNGLGASFGVSVTSPQNLTFDGKVKIPTQYTLDAAVFYARPRYELRLDFYNFTDQRNWSGVADFAGGDNVYAELPFHLEGTVRFRF